MLYDFLISFLFVSLWKRDNWNVFRLKLKRSFPSGAKALAISSIRSLAALPGHHLLM